MNSEKKARQVPRHLAIIMDGNGRWAAKRRMGRWRGHRRGVEVVRQVVKEAKNLGVEYLTLYAFSSENWRRPKLEVKGLMVLLKTFLQKWQKEMLGNGIRLQMIGNLEQLPAEVVELLKQTIAATANNKQLTLTLALSYGGRQEILRAAQNLAKMAKLGQIEIDDIDQQLFSSQLSTAAMPDPDLLIRTSGEFRISNFLLWQLAYTEIYICDKLWPDFTSADLSEAIDDFNSRERRFGLTSRQLTGEKTSEQ